MRTLAIATLTAALFMAAFVWGAAKVIDMGQTNNTAVMNSIEGR